MIHTFLNQFATARGSNRTQVPILNDGMRPAFACLKIVIFETPSNLASFSAVIAPSMRLMCSARVRFVGECLPARKARRAGRRISLMVHLLLVDISLAAVHR